MINASSTKMVPPITPPATGPATDASAAPIKDCMHYEYCFITLLETLMLKMPPNIFDRNDQF